MTLSFLNSKTDDLSEPPALSEQLLRRLWLGLPIAACGLVATLLAALVLLPLALNLRSELVRAQKFQRLQDQLMELKISLARSQADLKQAESLASKLRNLLVGGGDRGTVLATLDNEAKATGVSLALYEQNALVAAPGATPAKPAIPAPGAKPTPPAGIPAMPGAPGAPGAQAVPGSAAADGIVEKPLLLSVQGTFPQILAFVQRLERLQVTVKQQDLSLALPDKPAGGAPSAGAVALPGSSPILVMKLSLVVFDAPGEDATAPAGLRPPAPGPSAPAAAAPAGSSR